MRSLEGLVYFFVRHVFFEVFNPHSFSYQLFWLSFLLFSFLIQ